MHLGPKILYAICKNVTFYCPLGYDAVFSGTNCAAVGGTMFFAFTAKKRDAGAICGVVEK